MITNKVSKRLGCELVFDGDKEKDIIKAVDTLASRKDLGHLVSHLIRIAFESPEVYENKRELKRLVEVMSNYGMSPTRFKYFEQVTKELECMKNRVDAIYNMVYTMYMASEMGKSLGILGEKAKNGLCATFILERQVESLCTALGIDNLNHTFASNRVEDVKGRAKEVIGFALQCYGGEIEELKGCTQNSINSEVFERFALNIQDAIANAFSNLGSQVIATKSQNSMAENVEDQIIDLVENPNEHKQTNTTEEPVIHNESEDELEIKVPTGDVADQFKSWLLE